MCGISGIISKSKLERESSLKALKKMNALIEHRGPDDSGTYVGDFFGFGHTRLSIIDISHGGHQPMIYNERFVITYNGEIYNYIEIKDELESYGYNFSNNSDTEVILAGYAHWQENVVHKLNGMFAFAIYDLEKNETFLARDRTGVKPLYYAKNSGCIYFFSEPKQVILSDLLNVTPNKEAIKEYLAFQFPLGEHTLFSGINKLLPGHYMTVTDGEIKIHQYWSIDEIELDKEITYEQSKAEIAKLVSDSVKLRLRSDVPIGSYLSGGIDSSIIASKASQHKKNLSTYTFTSKNSPTHDESELAQITAKRINSNHNEIEIKYNSILELWKQSVYFMDEPEVGYSLLPQMEISQKVSEKLKVVLGGQGGDELFFGYDWHSQLLCLLNKKFDDISFKHQLSVFFSLLKKYTIKGKLKFIFNKVKMLSKSVECVYFDSWTSNGAYGLLKDKSVSNNFYENLNYNGSLLSIKKFEYKNWLHALLHVEDRSSMSASIESRVPLLDYRIAEYAFKLKPEYMIDGGLNKKLLIKAHDELLDSNITENKHKKGYASPINDWLKDKNVNEFVKLIINDENSFIYNFVTFKPIGTITPRQLWLLISLEIWHDIYITRELKVA